MCGRVFSKRKKQEVCPIFGMRAFDMGQYSDRDDLARPWHRQMVTGLSFPVPPLSDPAALASGQARVALLSAILVPSDCCDTGMEMP